MKDRIEIVNHSLTQVSELNLKGLKPTAIVGRITSIVQEYNPQGSELIPIVQEVYIRMLEKTGVGRDKARQSWVVASGGDFEGYTREHINETLNGFGIVAIKGDLLKKMAEGNPHINEIIQFLMLPNKRRCTQTELKIWADSDVIVLSKTKEGQWKVLAVISCKTSDHSRNTSVLFWAMAFVQLGIKYYLATQDLDNQFNEECKKAQKKQRRLFEAYCDRVFSTNPSTKHCSQIKSLIVKEDSTSDLTDELLGLAESYGCNTKTPLQIDDLEKS